MVKKMLIDATHAEECRVVVVDGNKVDEFDFESVNKRQLAGNIYLAKVTRVEPSLQAAFVDYGGNRHGFLAFSEIHPDYYQIPVADREALLEEERAYAEAMAAEEEEKPAKSKRGSRGRSRSKPAQARSDDAVDKREISESSDEIPGMGVVDLEDDEDTTAELLTDDPNVSDDADSTTEWQDKAPADDTADENAARDRPDAALRDSEIESVADEDVTDEIRAQRKPRPRRYKIQEVIKVRQILLVQVVKEERGNKGAALTTYLSLAGRYCVLMPNTARGGGISRKITNVADRKKLKEIASEIEVPKGAGLIIRTAGAKRTKSEIKRDYEYLLRLWEQIRDLTLKSIAPAPIYEEGNLIKRSIRDLYNREIDEVLVEGEQGYRVAKDFMKMIMPSHAKNVKHYQDPLPLFARFQVESYLSSMFNPTVQLKSGGYIVIGVTEALVAIDVNSGRATKEGSIEDTATKTNLEAAEEVARQLRLRDLAGLIVIDFIDMEDRRNNAAVEKRLKDKLKTDRARIQVGRISGFGLLEMSRQRLRPGMLEATTQPCPACHGTGLIRSDDNLALAILRQLEEEGVRGRTREVLLKAPVGIVNFLMNQKREHIAQIEARYGISVRVEADPFLVSPDFTIERFKTATRAVTEPVAPVISVDTSDMPDLPEPEEEKAPAEATPAAGEEKPKKRRRRRRSKKKGGNGSDGAQPQNGDSGNDAPVEAAAAPDSKKTAEAEAATATVADTAEQSESSEEKPKAKPKSTRSRSRSSRAKKPASDASPAAEESGAKPAAEVSKPAEKPEPAPETGAEAKTSETKPVGKSEKASTPEPEQERQPEMANGSETPEQESGPPPKKRGWWAIRN